MVKGRKGRRAFYVCAPSEPESSPPLTQVKNTNEQYSHEFNTIKADIQQTIVFKSINVPETLFASDSS